MKYLSCAVVALIGLTAPAAAADLGGSYKDNSGGVFETPTAGASVNWSGFYLGGGVGRNSTTHDIQGQRDVSTAKFLKEGDFLKDNVYSYPVQHAAKTGEATCPAGAVCTPNYINSTKFDYVAYTTTSYTTVKNTAGATLWKPEGSVVTADEKATIEAGGVANAKIAHAAVGDDFPNGGLHKNGDALLANGGDSVGYTLDTTSFFSSDGSAKGFTGSLGLGYDKQMGSMLFGVMGDYQFRGAKTTFGDTSIAQSDAIFLGARLGYLPTNKMLLYVLGGYTWLGHDSFASNLRAADAVRGCNTTDGKGCSATYGDGNFSGFTVGGGAEVAVTHALFLGLESRYTMYGKETIKTSTAVDNIQHQVETISMSDEPSEWYVGATLKLKMNSDGFASLK